MQRREVRAQKRAESLRARLRQSQHAQANGAETFVLGDLNIKVCQFILPGLVILWFDVDRNKQ